MMATARALEIIGEAANKRSPDFRTGNSGSEWTKMIGMRNILIHNYGGTDTRILWSVVKSHRPILIEQVSKMVDPKETGEVGDKKP